MSTPRQAVLETAMRLADERLARDGNAGFLLDPSGTPEQFIDVLALTQYTAWRARQMTGNMVRVIRRICPCHGYCSLVQTTTIPAEFPDECHTPPEVGD